MRESRKSKDNKGTDPPDIFSVMTVAGLIVFGWIMIYSGSFYLAAQRSGTLVREFNPFHFFLLQGMWILVGMGACYLFYRINRKLYPFISLPALLISIFMLIGILIAPQELNATNNRWINFAGFSMQPSEIIKPFAVVYLASVFSKAPDKKKVEVRQYIKYWLMPFTIVASISVGLVVLGKDLATAGVLGITLWTMLLFSNNKIINNIASFGMLIVGAISGVIFILIEDYRIQRVKTYLDFFLTGEVTNPLGSGYQLYQILIAIGSGGIWGLGFGQSKQKYLYLQETAFTDTIFAVVAEEFGFIGSLAVVVTLTILFMRWIIIAKNTRDRFSYLLVIGITSWFFTQSFIHLAVNVGLFPLTGIPLPFMSYGGSSLLSCMIGLGMLLNISKDAKL